MSSSMNSRLLALFLIVLAFSSLSFAQKDTGSIVGTVKDQTGALVANAKVTVTDVERGPALTTTNDEAEYYAARPMSGGRNTVMEHHRGSQAAVAVAIHIVEQRR